MNYLDSVKRYGYCPEAQKYPERCEQIQAQDSEQTQSQTIVESQLSLENKEPFHFLHLVQKQLIEAKKPEFIFDDNIYPKESRETWLAFENAVRRDDREKAEILRIQLLSTTGSLIKPKCTSIENPKTNTEVVQNILIKALCQDSSSIPEKILCNGLEKNSLPLIYLALKCGAQPEKPFNDGMGRQHQFLQIALDSPEPCNIAGIRLLFQFVGNPINLANGTLLTTPAPRSSFSPLKKAFEIGRLDVVRELLINGANPEIAWNHQQQEESLFIYAADKGHSEIVQFFLQVGFPVNYQNKNGRTALHFAKLRKNHDLVQDLLKAGADVNLIDNKGWNYLEFAKEGWEQFDKHAKEKLISAFQTGNFENVYRAGGIQKLVSNLFDINESVDVENNNLLHIVMKHLQNSYGIINGISEIRQLIDLGVDIHRKNNEDETPITILQKAIAAQEQFIHKMISCEPLEETGISIVQQIVIDAVADAQIQQGNANWIKTEPLAPIFLKKVRNEKNYLEALQSFNQFLTT
jgi:hypothetical protein